jgi:hypothetical protein
MAAAQQASHGAQMCTHTRTHKQYNNAKLS